MDDTRSRVDMEQYILENLDQALEQENIKVYVSLKISFLKVLLFCLIPKSLVVMEITSQ